MYKLIIGLLNIFKSKHKPITTTQIQMKEQFCPENLFSMMTPKSWIKGAGENFSVNAPNDGPSINATTYRDKSSIPLKEFANARYQGVKKMSIYKQVGKEFELESNIGVIREYEGTWPGDNHITYYVVACINKADIYASISLTTSKNDYKANKELYKKMFSTLTIHVN